MKHRQSPVYTISKDRRLYANVSEGRFESLESGFATVLALSSAPRPGNPAQLSDTAHTFTRAYVHASLCARTRLQTFTAFAHKSGLHGMLGAV